MLPKTIGVLALQGDFEKHQQRISKLGHKSILLRAKDTLSEIDALIIPGGESSTFLKLCNSDFRYKLEELISSGLPTFATCAGLVFLAAKVTNPKQDSLGLLDLEVSRNAYGRQLQSFVSTELKWTEQGIDYLKRLGTANQLDSAEFSDLSSRPIEGVFIRAPKITLHGEKVQVLAQHKTVPVLVRENNIMAASFHPELSEDALVHRVFLAGC